MKFTGTTIAGAYLVDLDTIDDDRGFFARAYCQEEFRKHGLAGDMVQANLSYNAHKGTLRGLHYQIEPSPETKLVRCIRGQILDVIVDLREDSPSFMEHISVKLDGDKRRALYVPAMVAHGFQTLCDDVEVLYMVSGFYNPEHERGLRADDPTLAIEWPLPFAHQSVKDASWPMICPERK